MPDTPGADRCGSVSEALGAFAHKAEWRTLPEAVRHETKRALLNLLGCALCVSRDPAIDQAIAVHRAFAGPPQAAVFGRSERLDTLGASFVNAVAGNFLDFDDTHLNTVIHPSAPVAPPALAVGEWRSLSGAAFLTAFAVGAEVACRVGNGVSPGHYARGWHITSTCGTMGAAAATAKLLDLPAAGIAHAIGIATSQAAGTVENLPTAAKNVSVGSAARNGLFAAFMAQSGYEAAPLSIEGPLGWARASGDDPDVPAMLSGLGSGWELLKNTYKPYPSGIVFHAVTDACLALLSRHGLDRAAIGTVTVTGDALLLARGDRPVNNERDARVSIHHSAAVALLRGRAGVADYAAQAVVDPTISAFRRKVRAELDADMPRGAARVTIEMANGRVLTETVLHARGCLERPLTDQDIEAKVREAVVAGGSGCDPNAVIAAVWTLDASPDTSQLVAALTPA